jgi:hypothetical protein
MNRCKRCNWPLSTNYEPGAVYGLGDDVELIKFYKCQFCGEITPIEKVIDVGGV